MGTSLENCDRQAYESSVIFKAGMAVTALNELALNVVGGKLRHGAVEGSRPYALGFEYIVLTHLSALVGFIATNSAG